MNEETLVNLILIVFLVVLPGIQIYLGHKTDNKKVAYAIPVATEIFAFVVSLYYIIGKHNTKLGIVGLLLITACAAGYIFIYHFSKMLRSKKK